MHLIGDNMELFVNIVNTVTRKCDLVVAKLGTDGKGPGYDGYNVMVPLGLSNNEVHWIFKDKDDHRHNPYTYKLQKPHSHQFCQSHSLLMAYRFCKGETLTISKLPAPDVRQQAYQQLLTFWQLLIKQLTKDGKLSEINIMVKDIIDTLIVENLDQEHDFEELIQEIGREFAKNVDIRYILNILKSDEAMDYCPHWN